MDVSNIMNGTRITLMGPDPTWPDIDLTGVPARIIQFHPATPRNAALFYIKMDDIPSKLLRRLEEHGEPYEDDFDLVVGEEQFIFAERTQPVMRFLQDQLNWYKKRMDAIQAFLASTPAQSPPTMGD